MLQLQGGDLLLEAEYSTMLSIRHQIICALTQVHQEGRSEIGTVHAGTGKASPPTTLPIHFDHALKQPLLGLFRHTHTDL